MGPELAVLLNSVILILQETLEAALMISVLLAVNVRLQIKPIWIFFGVTLGIMGACIYAYHIEAVSEWFDGVGQEFINALLQITIALCITLYIYWLFRFKGQTKQYDSDGRLVYSNQTQFVVLMIGIIALGLTREGAEVLLYLGGFFPSSEQRFSMAAGSGIGFGIGFSSSIILYYALVNIPGPWRFRSAVILLALFAANMASQAALQLTQADWLPHTQALWDSSSLISERSVLGHLFYAIFGYEATPSAIQVGSYVAAIVLVGIAAKIGNRFSAGSKI
jgi:high-affinity iron transporter